MDEEVFVVDGNEYQVGDDVSYAELHWSSDWNGYEVGYDDVSVVGLYSFIADPEVQVYINAEEGTILEIWRVSEED